MNKEELKKLASNPKFIEGIYNYCDRWCERCPFTARCLNYEFSEGHFAGTEDKDINNKEFWDKLGEVFALTLEMIADEAEELGIDLNEVRDNADEFDFEKAREESDKNPNVIEAKKYADIVSAWFKDAEPDFEEKENELSLEEELDLPDSSPLDEALKITDAIEVIRWYQYQIQVKLKRALFSFPDELEDDDFPKDSDGSAKVALIGIDRSIAAWGKLHTYFTERGDEILETLLLLSRLRKNVEKEFPNARAFKRIGFDD